MGRFGGEMVTKVPSPMYMVSSWLVALGKAIWLEWLDETSKLVQGGCGGLVKVALKTGK